MARNFAFKRVFLLDGHLIQDFRYPLNAWLIGKREWPIRATEAPVQALPAAFRGWNPTPNANHPLKANAGGKLSILSQNCSPRRQASLVPSKASKTRRLNVSPEARTSEILCKPNAGTKSAVDNRFVTRTRSAVRCWLLTSGPTPCCLCEHFSCKACPGLGDSVLVCTQE